MSSSTGVGDLDVLLSPVSEAQPAGADLRYDLAYDRIKTARRTAEEEPTKATGWMNVRDLVAKTLQTRSKDLLLATWWLEAGVRTDGYRGARDGLELIRRLLEAYWPTLYPSLDEDDNEPWSFRAAVLYWLDEKLPGLLSALPLTDNSERYGLLHYETTQVADAARKAALVEEGWPTAEQFEAGMLASSPEGLQELLEQVTACLSAVAELEAVCDAKFVEQGRPVLGFSGLKRTLDTARWVLENTARKKGQRPPADAGAATAEATTEAEATAQAEPAGEEPRAGAVGEPVPGAEAESASIADRPAALIRLAEITAFLRTDNPYDPLPYLLSRAVATGRLWAAAVARSGDLPSAPAGSRLRLRELFAGENWVDLLAESEATLVRCEKLAWIEPYRYAITALEQLGDDYAGAALAAREHLRSLLAALPDLPSSELEDGTPAASQDTQRWLAEHVAGAGQLGAAGLPVPDRQPGPAASAPETAIGEPGQCDEGFALIGAGRVADGLKLLQKWVAGSPSGRERFIRQLRVAEACAGAGSHRLAWPILDDLVSTGDRLGLEQWEDPALSVRLWMAFLRCHRQVEPDAPESKERARSVFARLCRLDISQAMSLEQDTAPAARRFRR